MPSAFDDALRSFTLPAAAARRICRASLVAEIRDTKDLPDAAEDVIKTFKAEFNPSVVAKPTVGDED